MAEMINHHAFPAFVITGMHITIHNKIQISGFRIRMNNLYAGFILSSAIVIVILLRINLSHNTVGIVIKPQLLIACYPGILLLVCSIGGIVDI